MREWYVNSSRSGDAGRLSDGEQTATTVAEVLCVASNAATILLQTGFASWQNDGPEELICNSSIVCPNRPWKSRVSFVPWLSPGSSFQHQSSNLKRVSQWHLWLESVCRSSCVPSRLVLSHLYSHVDLNHNSSREAGLDVSQVQLHRERAGGGRACVGQRSHLTLSVLLFEWM